MFRFRFRRSAPPALPVATVNAPTSTFEAEEDPPATVFKVRVSLHTDVGCVRELNEDSVRFVQPESPFELAYKGVMVVVCDGMGGHAGGEVASKLGVETIGDTYMNSKLATASALRESFLLANAAIFNKAKRDSSLHGMGTTGTALVLRGAQAFYAHVGDSRLYLVRNGDIYQMSEDHSMVMEMVRRGTLSAAEARNHPQSNIILRALGTQPQVEVSLWDEPFPLRAGDRWVLCSDGLSDLVEDGEIQKAASQTDIDAMGDSLIALARSRGGHDNVSVVIAEVLPLDVPVSLEETVTGEKDTNIAVETREVKIP